MHAMKIVTTPKADAFIREQGGKVWVWLDPRRGLVGSYIWLEAHCAPPGATKRSSFTRSSKRPHRFKAIEADGIEIHYAFARLDPPDELHFDVKGWRAGTRRLEAYWNGCIFVGEDIESPTRDEFKHPKYRTE
jgi:hypothetical protein